MTAAEQAFASGAKKIEYLYDGKWIKL